MSLQLEGKDWNYQCRRMQEISDGELKICNWLTDKSTSRPDYKRQIFFYVLTC
jgi:hypothetical protein